MGLGMKCPLCNNQMHEQWDLNESKEHPKFYICFYEKCSFYGMPRLSKEYFEEIIERE